MLALLKVLGKWGANVALIVSIPISSAKHDMKEHKKEIAIERAAFHETIGGMASSINDIRATQLEDRKLLNKIVEIELKRLELEKGK